MARKKTGIAVTLIDGIDELEQSKNLSREYIIESLSASLSRAYIKIFLKGWVDLPVRTEINEKTGDITIFRGKTVVATEDDITDDFAQIAKTDLDARGIDIPVGELYEVAIPLANIINDKSVGLKFFGSFKTSFQARLVEAEKKALIEIYGSKLGELITGRVEQYNQKTGECMVNIGKITVPLDKKDQIGDETFKVGQDIKVCIIDVESSPKGAKIRISRSDPLFLRRLFEQEIREIFDGTVIIKDIARNAGVRSKVAVYSNDPNVDPCGACIGVNGTRIQSISQNLGNGKEKEKIDIVLYDPCVELYIIESLVPGHVIGLQLDTIIDNNGKEVPHALAITKNGEVSTTVGTRGVNVFLAYKLTGYKIDVKQLDDALKEGLTFMGLEEIKARAEAAKNPKTVTQTVAPEVFIDEKEEEIIEEIIETAEEIEDTVEETVVPTPEVEEVVEEVVEETVAPVVEEVKPTTPEVEIVNVDVVKMDDLLSKLEEEKAAAEKSNKPRKSFKKKEEKVEVVKEEKKTIQGMAIYTDEELEELRRQEELDYEEESYGVDIDDDYDEYDSDDYYED